MKDLKEIFMMINMMGLRAEAEKPIQSYSHSIDKDNKIR